MVKKTIDVSTLTHIDQLLAEITHDTEIILTRDHAPFARLTVIPPSHPAQDRVPIRRNGVWISDDFDGFAIPDYFNNAL